MQRFSRLSALVLLIVAAAGAYQVARTRDTVLSLRGVRSLVQDPFGLAGSSLPSGGLRITWVSPEAERAGLKSGDGLSRIQGTPATGRAALARVLDVARPGDFLELNIVRRVDSAAESLDLRIRLEARAKGLSGAAGWLPTIVLSIAMPWLCLALGGWVALVRPSDGRAWLLLAMMLTFAQATGFAPMHWAGAGGVLGIAWHSFAQVTWPVSMLLFAIYFPERLAVDRKLPWVKWLLVGPLLLFALVSAVVSAIGLIRLESVAELDRILSNVRGPVMALVMCSIGFFFAALGYKCGTLESADARRRVRILVVGAQVSLTPTLFLVIPGLMQGVAPGDVTAPWISAIIFSFMFLFPVTLAYVIVVQRALDVRVFIRQGMQYALARGGVTILRNLIWVGIIAGVTLLVVRPGARNVEIVRGLATGTLLLVVTRRGSEKLLGWTDRRFFREAYNAERVLTDLGERVVTMVDASEILETIARQVSDALHTPRVACFLESGVPGFRMERGVGYGPPSENPPSLPADSATVAHLRKEGGPVRVYIDDPSSWIHKAGGPDQEERKFLRDLQTQLLIPLPGKDRLAGIISLGPKLSEEAYSATDLRLLRSVASQAGLALENSRLAAAVAAETAQRERHNREVEIAREVQERLFPQRLPQISGLDFAGVCRPALGVGGDYYDFLALPGGCLGIAVGDVSGKGIGAALMMASLQASLRGQTMSMAGNLERVLSNVNQLVFEASPDNRYATFFYAQYDPATRSLTYVNAGHCPPMLLREAGGVGEIVRLKAGGTVVGLFSEASWKEETVQLREGDRLVAYSDGISEAFNSADEEFGDDRLAGAALSCAALEASPTIARLMELTDAFVAGAPQSDDMTIVVVRVVG